MTLILHNIHGIVQLFTSTWRRRGFSSVLGNNSLHNPMGINKREAIKNNVNVKSHVDK